MTCSCCGNPIWGKAASSRFIHLPICPDCRFSELILLDRIADQTKAERSSRITRYILGFRNLEGSDAVYDDVDLEDYLEDGEDILDKVSELMEMKFPSVWEVEEFTKQHGGWLEINKFEAV